MGDVRYAHPLARLRAAEDPIVALHWLSDEDLIAALAAAASEEDTLLTNVLATEAQNRARRSRAVSEHVIEGVYAIDSESRVTYLNAAAERLLGLPRGDALGRSVDEVTGLWDAESRKLRLASRPDVRALASGDVVEEEDAVFERTDGSVFRATLTAVPIRSDDAVDGVVVSFRDVTERQRQKAALAESERRYRVLADNATDLVTITKPDGRIVYASPSSERLTGYRPDELVGRRVSEFLHADDVQAARERRDAAIAAREAWTTLGRGIHKDGHAVWFESNARPVVDPESGDVREVVTVTRDVTERRAWEERLMRREHHLAVAQRVAHVGSWDWDVESDVVEWSDELYRIFGMDRSENPLRLGDVLARLTSEGRARLTRLVDEALHEGRAYAGVSRLVRPDGTERVVRFNGVPITNDSGRVTRLIGTLVDVTEMADAEARLMASQERLRMLVSEADVILCTLDASGRITGIEGKALDAFGRSADELVGQIATRNLDEQSDAARAVRAVLAGHDVERTVPIGDVWLKVRMAPTRDARGTVIGAVAVAMDVTREKRAEAAAARDAARMRLLASASDAIARAPSDPRAIAEALAYRVAEDVGGYCLVRAAADARGRGITTAGHHPDPARRRALERIDAIPQRVDEGILGGVVATGEPLFLPIVDRDSLRRRITPQLRHLIDRADIGSLIVVPIHHEGRVLGAMAVTRGEDAEPFTTSDVGVMQTLADRAAPALDHAHLHDAERKALERAERAEAEVRRLVADLEQRVADRTRALEAANRELEAFSDAVSHDLRAPLRGIDYFAQALREEYGSQLDAVGREYLDRMHGEAERLTSLVNDLLAFSRAWRHDMGRQRVDLSGIAQDVLDELKVREPERRVDARLEPNVVVDGDPVLLRVALENLIGNAWKYTARRDVARVEFGSASVDGEEACFVSDNGAGFDPALADRLFQPFQRLHGPREFEGTGLGLATVRRVVERHGGRVWAESRPGEGATFWFTLG